MLALAHFAVLLLGDRLVAAAVQRGRVEVFVVSGENPVEALRAEIGQRRLPVRTIALALPRASVTVKPIELPAMGGSARDDQLRARAALAVPERRRHVRLP